jgi:hypothetical protein
MIEAIESANQCRSKDAFSVFVNGEDIVTDQAFLVRVSSKLQVAKPIESATFPW